MKLEEKFTKIEEILAKLEDNEIGLDDSFKLYNEGVKLVAECNESIEKVEKELQVLGDEA